MNISGQEILTELKIINGKLDAITLGNGIVSTDIPKEIHQEILVFMFAQDEFLSEASKAPDFDIFKSTVTEKYKEWYEMIKKMENI
jgi:hypothetical protein